LLYNISGPYLFISQCDHRAAAHAAKPEMPRIDVEKKKEEEEEELVAVDPSFQTSNLSAFLTFFSLH
jgi:hypothetical protein